MQVCTACSGYSIEAVLLMADLASACHGRYFLQGKLFQSAHGGDSVQKRVSGSGFDKCIITR